MEKQKSARVKIECYKKIWGSYFPMDALLNYKLLTK